MFWKTAKIVLAGALALGVLAITVPRSDWLSTAIPMTALLVASGVVAIPKIRQTILSHRQATIASGGAAILLGVGLMVAAFNRDAADNLIGASVVFILVGVLLLGLPKMLRQIQQAAELQKQPKAAMSAGAGFDPVAEVRAILSDLWANLPALTRVVGPWFVLFCLLPLPIFYTAFWKSFFEGHPGLKTPFLLSLLIGVWLELCLILLSGIQWTRFVVTAREPRLTDIPFRALWGWLWRWLILGWVLRSTDHIDSWTKSHLPLAAKWELSGLSMAVVALVLIGTTPFALVLPAVAMGKRDANSLDTITARMALGRKLYGGAALILIPYELIAWMLSLGVDYTPEPQEKSALLALSLALFFAMVIVATTYLARIHVRIAGANPTVAA